MQEKFKFELTVYELNAIIKGLKELPYKEAHSTIEKIIEEYEKQALELQKAAKKEAKKEESKA